MTVNGGGDKAEERRQDGGDSGYPQEVAVGHLTVDDTVRADGTVRMASPGGAALYAAVGASLWAEPVGLVTRLGRDYPREAFDTVRECGIDLQGLTRTLGPSIRHLGPLRPPRSPLLHPAEGSRHV